MFNSSVALGFDFIYITLIVCLSSF